MSVLLNFTSGAGKPGQGIYECQWLLCKQQGCFSVKHTFREQLSFKWYGNAEDTSDAQPGTLNAPRVAPCIPPAHASVRPAVAPFWMSNRETCWVFLNGTWKVLPTVTPMYCKWKPEVSGRGFPALKQPLGQCNGQATMKVGSPAWPDKCSSVFMSFTVRAVSLEMSTKDSKWGKYSVLYLLV